MSRLTGWNGGSLAVVNIRLAGSISNTYSGTTVVDGQGALASLWLQKTGGAVAIAGGHHRCSSATAQAARPTCAWAATNSSGPPTAGC